MSRQGFGTLRRSTIGKMRHRAILEEKKTPEGSDEYDARGQENFTWESVLSEQIPCEMKQLFGREREQARTVVANATHRVTMHYIRDVPLSREMRLKIDDHNLYIGDIDNIDESNRTLVLLCEEKVK
ncbi:MAG: phage head closure protein [Planctomycetota bacterium]